MMRDGTLALVADLGGTNVRFALADTSAPQPLRADSIRRYRVAEFGSLADAGRRYLGEMAVAPRRGVFAVAGRVDGDRAQITNHPWVIGIEETRRQLDLDVLDVHNDSAAMSMAIVLLDAGDLHAIGPLPLPTLGGINDCTFAVVGPGTGLGVGALLCRAGRYETLETEGGHVGFAPVTDEEIDVLRAIRARHRRVSIERLVSGPGLVNVYVALCDIADRAPDDLPPETITARATQGSDRFCLRAVELVAELLGAMAGDFVLAYGAWNGVYLGGGLTPKLLPWLETGAFRARFENKGRFAGAMARVPTAAILHPDAGLLGAAAIAALARGVPLRQGDKLQSEAEGERTT